MGVFARDPPPPGRAGASSSSAAPSSSLHASSLPSDLPPAPLEASSIDRSRSSAGPPTSIAADELPSDPTNQGDEEAQDDDDQGTVDEEAGIIRCICGCDDDDGFTIQCDRCLVWQHCACFGMSQASVPDEYLCEQCEPRPVDVAFAQAHQQKRKNNEARKALLDRNLKRQAQALASKTFDPNYLAQVPVSSPTTSTHPASANLVAVDDISSAPQPTPIPAAVSAARSRKPSQALDLSNTQFVVPEVPASAGTAQRGGKQRKGQKGSRRGLDTPTSVSGTPVRGVFTPGSTHERLDDPFDIAEQLEAWHVEFTPITKNMIADPSILENLAAAMLDWEDGSPLKGVFGPAGRVIVPTAASTRHALSAKHPHSEFSSSTSSPSPASPHAASSPSALETGPIAISAVGDECVPVELSGPSLADISSRTYVKHISESASAGVFSNLLYVNNSADEPQRSWSASRAFSRPVMHGLFAEASIPAGAFISEFRGELCSASAYRNDPINQYAALGATKPHVHLLPPPLNLAIDARRFGNEARFARFSCHPNAVLRPILFHPNGQPSGRSRVSSRAQSPASAAAAVASAALSARQRYADTPPAESRSDEPQLLFGLFALTDIPRTHEITLGWEWDDAHIVHFLPELVQNPYLESRDDDVDADQHTANMVALAEKGEFPYADTEFSCKMSTVAAALLGSVLCACIGSAAPPGGGGGASANNGRKQDCAVAQMLRVGNGMSLLNVTMPGKTNRRAKLPDFTPLVGIRRHWRPYSLPPTPETSIKDEDPIADAALLEGLADERESEAMQLLHGMDVDGEIGCGGNEAISKRRKRRGDDRMQIDDGESTASDSDDHDARSNASSLTDPLSGLSDQETLSEDEDEDLMDALRAADGVRSRPRISKSGEASAVDPELSGLFLLPPKKRSMRTRIKAIMSPDDDEEEEDGSNDEVADHDDAEHQVKAAQSRRSENKANKTKSGVKRKGKRDHSRAAPDFSSDEDNAYDDTTTPIKKRRKSGNIMDPSSPLSSVPSPDSADSSVTPPPAMRKQKLAKGTSDVELSKKKRAAKRNARAAESTRPKESASKRRKREEARIHRNAILDLGDTESSEGELSDGEEDDEEETEMDVDDSQASTPRASKKAEIALDSTSRFSATPEDAQVLQKAKKDRVSSPAVAEDRRAAKRDTPTKTKKVRRILSDSEHSSGDEEASAPAVVKKEEASAASASEPVSAAQEENKSADDASNLPAGAVISTAPQAPAPAPAPVPAPVPEVKKEEPARVKLSLAEYKRRLAERRVSEQQKGDTPSIATPTSEVAPSPSPAVERNDPLPTRPSEALPTPTPEAVSTPSGTDAATTSAAVPRGVLFTSISAPTAIRSVEIPKSPSPEPTPVPGAVKEPEEVGATSSVPPEAVVFEPAGAAAPAASADTPALLARLETRRARAPSLLALGDATAPTPAAGDGFVRPATTPTSSTYTTTAPTAQSPSTGSRVLSGKVAMPPSPSGSASSPGFNPPKAPRAFMSPPSTTALPPPAAVPSSPTAPAAPLPVTSTPARSGGVGAATPSTASSTSSRYPPPAPTQGLTSPTPSTTPLPYAAPPRNFAGVPKGPASMRDDAWAEAREVRSQPPDYPGPSRDGGWGERTREPSNEPVRGWGRDRSREYPTDAALASRDSQYPTPYGSGGYRRPSVEYEDPRAYDRSAEYRGIGIRGRSLANNPPPPGAGGGGREYREYDEPAQQGPPGGGRGGFRSGWGGRGRPRGGGERGGRGGRGGWMR